MTVAHAGRRTNGPAPAILTPAAATASVTQGWDIVEMELS